ncbi:DUF362 domain-containing protein [Desulfosarcina sp. OttesenSCG-928-B08]|nr:DUF362 domain-containing protein [Desulfosarcina sp. OttesenSCG-928-B08]
MTISRRKFLQGSALTLGAVALANTAGSLETAFGASRDDAGRKAKVYFTKDLSVKGLRKVYAQVRQNMTGKIAVKLHTGEPNGPYIIPQAWVKAFMQEVPGSTIVECNVLYPSPRQTTEGHRKTLETNGWTFSPVDIMDADGDVNLPVIGGKWFKEVAFGKNILNYDSMLVLTHFKGHTMGGFGGSLKNISIGCASGKVGKEQLHREGSQVWSGGPNFMERMVEGGKAVADHFGPRITYINVLRSMSVDCDCTGTSAAPPTAPDIGILASTDILAIDQASVDMVYALPDAQKRDIVERIESRSGLRQLTYMKELGMGNNAYEIVPVS